MTPRQAESPPRQGTLSRAAIADLREADPEAAAKLEAVAAFAADAGRVRGEFASRVAITFAPNPKGDIAEASERVGFLIDGVDPTGLGSVRRWWAQRTTGDMAGDSEGMCQVTGHPEALARIMPGLMVKKGTPQALISANFDSALRYNAVQSRGAQISVTAAIRSHQALNWLLGDDHHHRQIGQTTYVWWLRGDLAFNPFDLIANPDAADVEAMLARPWTGRPGVTPSDSFRVLGLTLTEGRVVIRFDHTSTLRAIETNTRRWLDLIARQGKGGRTWWPSIDDLAEAATAPGTGAARQGRRMRVATSSGLTATAPGTGAARQAQRDRAIQALMRAAITGSPLPRPLMAALVDRCRAVPIPQISDDKIDWTALGSRLSALKLCRHLKEENMSEQPSAGEICGRILAQLDNAQHQALGDTNRSVADRYYAGASTRPASVFPRLFNTANAHLSKLGRQGDGRSHGAQIAISRRLSELSGLLLESGGFPATLSLDEQADFALAYWDEQGRRFRKRATDPETNEPQEETP